MPVWRTRIAGLAPEDISRIHRLNRAITNPQTHYGDAGLYPSENRSLVSENLGFDLVRVESTLFVLRICHLDGCRSIINSFC